MKHEPTVVTIVGIYRLMDLELEDLNTIDVRGSDQAFCQLCEAADAIRDDLDGTFLSMQKAGAILENGQDPARLHAQFTEINRIAVQIAGKAVRLAAIARQGITDTITGTGGNYEEGKHE